MKAIRLKQKQQIFSIKSYQKLWQLKTAIHQLNILNANNLQLSVLGKLNQNAVLKSSQNEQANTELNQNLKTIFGVKTDFATFNNPEIGTLFITGTVVPHFLQDMYGSKQLGEFPSGPYGILRGLGFTEKIASSCLQDLYNNYFLLILRSYEQELKFVDELLQKNKSILYNICWYRFFEF
ncbi:hypothetical protein DFQ03_1325 [Maribacter caenipelagi]|uniref:Uncharacterized protein n=1 Tax=Maribacter caenipelagi TaxID=1447781 RepID=A0A4R7D829_9FLAO|nr:hypothetical protein [Maribacter caenipelagi]TDS16837.1 hypothetical protein DFQ03_1325 [Maribacter caenipelagi]